MVHQLSDIAELTEFLSDWRDTAVGGDAALIQNRTTVLLDALRNQALQQIFRCFVPDVQVLSSLQILFFKF